MATLSSRLRLGAHMSTGGGLPRAVERAEQVEATALQVFVKSSRQWKARPLPDAEVSSFRAAIRRRDLRPYTLAHASYLINLASPEATTWERSIQALGDELDRCAQLDIPYLVLHPGSHVGSGEQPGLTRIAGALDRVLAGRARRGGSMVLLENTAGQGSNLGHRFEQIGQVRRETKARRLLGVCFDTCHALAAGYGLEEPSAYRETWEAFDRAIGLEHLKAFHLNDSKHGLGTRRDRHEHIGDGEVGLKAFRRLLNDGRFVDLPMVLETPKREDPGDDRRNLELLRSMVPRRRR